MTTILLLIALISFLIAIFPVATRINLIALGLFCLTLIQVLGAGVLHL